MKSVLSLIREDREFSASVRAALTEAKKPSPLPISVNGLAQGASAAYITEAARELVKELSAPIIILASSESERDKIAATLTNETDLTTVVYKKRDFVFHNISASHDNERERLSVLLSVCSGECDAIVTTPDAALQTVLPVGMLTDLVTKLEVGAVISPEALCEKLVTLGYASVDSVESAGQFAKRGGIVDFLTSADEDPVRIEFFGDEIDRMVRFDIITQRSIERADAVTLSPAKEVMIRPELSSALKAKITSLLSRAKDERAKTALKSDLNSVENGLTLLSRDKYMGIIYPERECLFDYLFSFGVRAALVIGTNECENLAARFEKEIKGTESELLAIGAVDKECLGCYGGTDAFKKNLAKLSAIHINSFSGTGSLGELGGIFGFRSKRTVGYGANHTMLIEDLKMLLSSGYRVFIECESKQGCEAALDLLRDMGTEAIPLYDGEIKLTKGASVSITVGNHEGFDLIMPKVALLSMAEDTGRRVMQNRRRQRILRKSGGAGQKIMSYADLEVGDYVVHANYGIGRFEGMQSVRVDGVTRDYITIQYAGTDKLYMPCDRLEMIGKYIGARAEDGTVKLSKMGGSDWTRAKSKAKSAVKDIAEKLIKLYAERQRTVGYSFPPDSELEDEFAADFEFIETEAQAQAIEEIKADMMKPVPMNRLLCGDVGFGKTEVALRAAFKAIMGGKQVAILVPTTILALQHYETALSRMRGYPVTVEMLSRFRTPKEQARITEEVKRGKVDILIGTHKLLGKSIEFRDLGLLIIDEEQRFGVAQKEKLKELSTNVDVLTLSATPIPRTLNMAINGISDMSVLDEAPENRRPVQTYVMEHDEITVHDAIRREMLRGGQVLYLFNNIETIDYVADKIGAAIPEARIAVAHGRMDKDEIEDIWQLLVRGEVDVLVCTTIIETGVDLPMANTLIIENADKMGLSQLHQIRGRVGRSERQAYAYFTYRPGKALTEIARKRLSAIREYAEFGAGFKIALCDLEIRGAGNILGAEQHGYIDSVGYDLYVKLLSEAVLEERGEKKPDEPSASIEFKVNAYIPEYYVARAASRMEIYKKISLIRTPEDKDDIYDELCDRFGDLPKPCERLLDVALCRALAETIGIPRVEHRGMNILFHAQKIDLSIWSAVLDKHKGRLIGGSALAPIVYKLKAGEEPIEALRSVLLDYYKEMKE